MSTTDTTTAPSTERPNYNHYPRNALANVVTGLAFIVVVGLIPEPARQIAMALMLAFGAVVYLRHGLKGWEWVFAAAIAICAVLGFFTYIAIGTGWLIHTVSDALHHRIGRPMFAKAPMSSFGCAIFDPVISIWFLTGAPAVITIPFWS
jgi:hypothetical protein